MCLVPFAKRIMLLVRSRTKGLGLTIGVMGGLALVAWTDGRFIYWASGILAIFIAVPLILSADRRDLVGSGAVLWLQTPVSRVRFLLAGFAETVTATIGIAVILAGAALLYGHALGWEPPRPLGYVLPVGALASFVTASAAFGTAFWLPRGSRAAVVLLILLALFVFDPELSQPDVVRGGAIRLARIVLFPAPDILRVVLGLTGDIPFRLQPLLACLAWAGGWIVIGVLGFWRSVTRGQIGL